MDIYHSSQIVANVLFVLVPMFFIFSKRSSKRTKNIAKVVLVFVLLGLIGQLGTGIEKQRTSVRQTAAQSAAHLDVLATAYSAPDGNFSIHFPQYPNTTTATQDSNGVQVQSDTYLAANFSNDTKYSVQVLKYPEYTAYMRDHQRQMLQQIIQQVNDSFSATVVTPGNNGQYICGFSAYKEHFTYQNNGTKHDGYAVAALDYNNFYVLVNYGRNTATFNDFVKSFVPKGGCNYSTTL